MILRLARSLFGFLLSALAIAVLAAAVIVSLIRVMLPGIGQYREEIQDWASAYMGQTVTIEAIGADWRGWTPYLHFTNISLRAPDDQRAITRFQQASVRIDLLASLAQRQMVPGELTVSGVQLSVVRSRDGAVTIEGVTPEDADAPSYRRNALVYWLHQQRHLSIQGATVTWHDHKARHAPLAFTEVALRIRSDGEHHLVEGSALLPAGMGERMRFALDAHGDLLTEDWYGEVYLQAQGVSPSFLAHYAGPPVLPVAGGRADLHLWSAWRKARVMSIDGDFELADLELGSGTQRTRIRAAQGLLQARRGAEHGWQLIAEDLLLNTDRGQWRPSRFELLFSTDPKPGPEYLSMAVDYLRLDDAAPVMSTLELLPRDWRELLRELGPTGSMTELRFDYRPSAPRTERFLAEARVVDLMTRPRGAIPGLNGVDVRIAAGADGGLLSFDTQAMQISVPERLPEPLWVDRLSGGLHWARTEGGWSVISDSLMVANNDLEAELRGRLELGGEDGPEANLVAAIRRGSLENMARYLPLGLLPAKGEEWLLRAVPSGRIISGGAILRGPLKHFPFDAGEGVFEVQAVVTDAILEYARSWPRIEELEAEVLFQGRGIAVNAVSGKIFDADLTRATARIDDVTRPPRTVVAQGRFEGAIRDTRQFVLASPLREGIGKRIEELVIEGAMALDLNLRIPLGDFETELAGTLHLPGNRLAVARLGMEFTGLKGAVEFSRKDWSAPALEGSYRGRPVRLELAGGTGSDPAGQVALMRGRADAGFILEHLAEMGPGVADWAERSPLVRTMAGETDWSARLALPAGWESGGDPARLQIDASLEGMAIDAPAPLGKGAAERRPLELETALGQAEHKEVRFRYGNVADGEVVYTSGEAGLGFHRAALRFGEATSRLPQGPGLWVGGRLPELQLSAWRDFLGTQGPDALPRAATLPDPTRVELTVDRLEVLQQWLDQARLEVDKAPAEWTIRVDSSQAAGTIRMPHERTGGPVVMDFQRLALQRGERGQDGLPQSEADPRRLPPLELRAQDFSFDGYRLGAMDLSTVPDPHGLQLNRLQFRSPAAEIDATGSWRLLDGVQHSQFNIDVRSPALAGLLENFGYTAPAIEGGETSIAIDAAWQGTPADFALKRLNGMLRLEVGAGRFLDLDPKAGRLFGLLSLQTLPRRLSLDFNDLFKKGFTFDRIEGSFSLDDGNAYTNNLTMEGPSARVTITGRTGLADQDYDQRVTVTPQVASSLPVASALFGPPGMVVGGVLFLAERLFKAVPNQIDAMLSRQYTITGSWDDPVIQ